MKKLLNSFLSAGKFLWDTRDMKRGKYNLVFVPDDPKGKEVTMSRSQIVKFIVKNKYVYKK